MYKLTHKYGKTHNISLSLSLYICIDICMKP